MFGNAVVFWFTFSILICFGAGALGGVVVSRRSTGSLKQTV